MSVPPRAVQLNEANAFLKEHPEVQFVVDDQDGAVPVLYVKVRAELGIGFRFGRFPVGAVHVVVHEPDFFRFSVKTFQVEYAVVGDKGFETFFVVAGEPVNGISAETRADSAQTGGIHVRFFRRVVRRVQQILHGAAAPVATDSIVPVLPGARHPPAAGRYDDVAGGGHQLHIPAIGKKLAEGRLRASLAV